MEKQIWNISINITVNLVAKGKKQQTKSDDLKAKQRDPANLGNKQSEPTKLKNEQPELIKPINSQMEKITEKYLTCEDVAERYGVKKLTVWGWIREKKLNAIQTGKLYRIRQRDLEDFESIRSTKN